MYGSNATAFGKSSTTKKPYTAGHTNSSLAGSVRTKKKIEGYDGGQSRADPHSRMMESGMSQGYRASQIGNNFSQNVERLKNQGGKQVEEEYIKALQEEIKILEYQMKILKDKEIEQQAAVSQIDKFFSDGVPLNPNILALKSQYQNKKSEEQRVIETMRKRIMEFEKNALDLEDEIKYHQENRGKLENEKNMTEDDIKKVIDDIKTQISHEKHQKEELQKTLLKMQDRLKKKRYNQKMTRDLEREKILSTHKNETQEKNRERFRRDIETKDQQIQELGEEIEKLKGEGSLNPKCNSVDAENNEMQKKILHLDKEISLAQGKIKEAEFLMETRRLERANESLMKRNLQNKIEMIKVQIDEAHRMNEIIIEHKVKEKQENEIRNKVAEIMRVEDRIHNTQERMAKEEQEIERICNDKVPLQQDIIEQEQIKETLEKQIEINRKMVHDLKIQKDMFEEKNKLQAAQFEPLQKSEAKFKDSCVALEQNIKNNKERMAQFDKQIEFAKHVKALNFNDLKVLNSTNDTVNTDIINFMRRYEEIKAKTNVQL